MNNNLRSVVDLHDRTLQKSRIAYGNRLSAIKLGKDVASKETVALLERWHERFLVLEDYARKDVEDIASEIPIIELMVRVKGVGLLTAARVASMIDINRASTVSALWKYAGYGVNDEGARDRPVKGEQLCYNKRLKCAVYIVASSFLKCGSSYRSVYDSSREYYEANRPDWTKGHQHLASMRKMSKLWLSHLWVTWREIEGLTTNSPYVHDRLGHVHLYTPDQFGWGDEDLKKAA